MNKEGTKASKSIIIPSDSGASLMAGSIEMISRRKYNKCWSAASKLNTIIEKDVNSTPGDDCELLTEVIKIPQPDIH